MRSQAIFPVGRIEARNPKFCTQRGPVFNIRFLTLKVNRCSKAITKTIAVICLI